MTPPDDLVQSKKWLSRTASALEDACADLNYVTNQKKPINLFFDPHFLYPPLALRRPLDTDDPSDWLDISAAIVFSNLSKYSPRILGYRFVLTHLTFLTIEKNYKFDFKFIDELNSIKDERELFDIIRKRTALTSGDSPLSQQQVEERITGFLASSLTRHAKLRNLLALVRNRTIVTEGSAVPADLYKNSEVDPEEFKKLHEEIETYRRAKLGGNSADQWTTTMEAYQLLRNRNITDLAVSDKYLFLSWPGSRGYYPNPHRYHRLVTSVFFRMIALFETPNSVDLIRNANAHLLDIKDQIDFLLKKVLASEKRGEELTPIIVRNITSTRNEYVANLRGNLKMMEESERTKLAKGFAGTKREVREALKDASSVAKNTGKILSEIADEFRRDEISSGWDELPPDHPIRRLLS